MDLTFYWKETDNADNTSSHGVEYEEVEKNQAGSGSWGLSRVRDPFFPGLQFPSIPFLPAPLPSLSPPISNPPMGQAPLLRS